MPRPQLRASKDKYWRALKAGYLKSILRLQEKSILYPDHAIWELQNEIRNQISNCELRINLLPPRMALDRVTRERMCKTLRNLQKIRKLERIEDAEIAWAARVKQASDTPVQSIETDDTHYNMKQQPIDTDSPMAETEEDRDDERRRRNMCRREIYTPNLLFFEDKPLYVSPERMDREESTPMNTESEEFTPVDIKRDESSTLDLDSIPRFDPSSEITEAGSEEGCLEGMGQQRGRVSRTYP